MNKAVVALGIALLVISFIPLQYISATVQVSPSYIQDYRDSAGRLIAQVPHQAVMETVYPYRWFGLVMLLLGAVVVGIGAMITKGATPIE